MSPIDPGFVRTLEKAVPSMKWTFLLYTVFHSTGITGRSTSGPPSSTRSATRHRLPVWVSEVGVSTFGAEEVQVVRTTAHRGTAARASPRIHWYSLYDLPRAWPATTRHREAEGSSYYRHFYMGLLREDGTPKRALRIFTEFTPELGDLSMVPFRRSSARVRRQLVQGPRDQACANRAELG